MNVFNKILTLIALAPLLGRTMAQAQLSSAPPLIARECLYVSQDPLLRQIRDIQVRQKNGGVTAVVRIASGQTIDLQLDIRPANESSDGPDSGAPDNASAGLRPFAGLIAGADKPSVPARSGEISKPSAQLKVMAGQGARQSWGETPKIAPGKSDPNAGPRKKRRPS